MATEPILTDAEVDEALYHFGNLLRLDTSNPPGNEAIASRYVAGVLATQDVPYHVVETAFNRTNLVARLGVGRPDEGVLVSAHMDVSLPGPRTGRIPRSTDASKTGSCGGAGPSTASTCSPTG